MLKTLALLTLTAMLMASIACGPSTPPVSPTPAPAKYNEAEVIALSKSFLANWITTNLPGDVYGGWNQGYAFSGQWTASWERANRTWFIEVVIPNTAIKYQLRLFENSGAIELIGGVDALSPPLTHPYFRD